MISQNKEEFNNMNLTYWHQKGFKGKSSTIVVLDDKGKPHTHTRVIEPFNDNNGSIGHKTNVCSVLREVAPETEIIAFNWFGSGKEKIIDWIKEHEKEIDAVNCSFTGSVGADIFERLKDLNIPIIAASGNNSYTDKVNPVARYDWTIAVGAWVERFDRRASYSNHSEDLDIVAYTNIYIPTSDGYDRLMYFNGTSCSAPVVCGLLAIYNGWLKENGLPKLSRDDARSFLMDYTLDKMEEGFDFESGHGLARLPYPIPEIAKIEIPVEPTPEPVEVIEEVEEVAEFKDTKEHWAREYIDFVADKGLMTGYADGSFQPNKPMTRAEVATIIARLEGFEKK